MEVFFCEDCVFDYVLFVEVGGDCFVVDFGEDGFELVDWGGVVCL